MLCKFMLECDALAHRSFGFWWRHCNSSRELTMSCLCGVAQFEENAFCCASKRCTCRSQNSFEKQKTMHACCCEKGEKEAREHQILQNLHQKRNKNMKHIHGQKNIKKTYDEVRMKLGRGILTLQDNFILSDLTSKRPQSRQ